MANPKLFRLKAEVAQVTSGPRALTLPIARVRVDTGVFHLDQIYDYAVPEKISAQVATGVRVQLPFAGRETEGIIVERVQNAQRAGELKAITKVLSPHPVATIESLKLFDTLAQKFACNPWDIIRSAIPPRVASVDKVFSKPDPITKVDGKSSVTFETFHPYAQPYSQLNSLINQNLPHGSILIVAPDEKDVDLIIKSLVDSGYEPLKLTSAMSREQRYLNFLKAMSIVKCIVVGTRSAIFTPVADLSTIIVFKESSFDHYEVRSPGWNTRSVALIRSKAENLKLVLMGFSPSIEVAYEIENRNIQYVTSRESIAVKAFKPLDGALLPGRIYSEIRSAITSGPILFLAPRKGYGNALLCAHCRNVALCECGGRLTVGSKLANPTCVHCGKNFAEWKCSFCHRDKQYLAARGIDRAAEEISRAFPGYPVIISAGEVIKTKIERKSSFVLATPGAQPEVEGGYSAVVVLDGMRFFAHTDLRTAERARELFFETSALLANDGKVLLVIDDSHPICASIARWNVAPLLKRELSERRDLNLPPFVSSVVLVLDQSFSSQIISGLKKAKEQGRLPSTSRIFGPVMIGKGQAKIVIHVENSESEALISAIHELQKRRSIAKKEFFTVRINPYSL